MKDPTRQFELSKLLNSSESPIKDKTLSEDFKNPVKGVTEHIKTNEAQKVLSGSDWSQKIAKLQALKKLGKAIPGVGAIAALVSGEDASAAVPVLDSAEPTGPAVGSFDDRLEKGQLSPEEKQQMMVQQAKIRALQGMGQ